MGASIYQELYQPDEFAENCLFCDDGNYHVYYWENEIGEVFYVGSGIERRYRDTVSRSDEFKEYISKHKCRPLIAAFGMSKDNARKFEADLIEIYRGLGFPLQNVLRGGCMPLYPA